MPLKRRKNRNAVPWLISAFLAIFLGASLVPDRYVEASRKPTEYPRIHPYCKTELEVHESALRADKKYSARLLEKSNDKYSVFVDVHDDQRFIVLTFSPVGCLKTFSIAPKNMRNLMIWGIKQEYQIGSNSPSA